MLAEQHRFEDIDGAKRIGPELIENNSVSSEMVPVLRWANGAAVAAH